MAGSIDPSKLSRASAPSLKQTFAKLIKTVWWVCCVLFEIFMLNQYWNFCFWWDLAVFVVVKEVWLKSKINWFYVPVVFVGFIGMGRWVLWRCHCVTWALSITGVGGIRRRDGSRVTCTWVASWVRCVAVGRVFSRHSVAWMWAHRSIAWKKRKFKKSYMQLTQIYITKMQILIFEERSFLVYF